MTRRSLLLPLAATVLSGCLLPEPPPPARLFAPVTTPAGTRAGNAGTVRLRPVRTPLHLREAITWRRNDVEYGSYDQRRWTEQPSTYVTRALEDALAAVGVSVAGDDAAPALTVEVLHFEEVLAPTHEAAVEIEIALHSAGHVLVNRRFAAQEPLAGDDPLEMARGMGRSLDRVAAEAAAAVRAAAAAPRPRTDRRR